MPDTTTCAPIRASRICCAALDWEVDQPQPPSRPGAEHVVGGNRTVQSLESQLTHRLELEKAVGGGEHALGDQNLPGLGLTTQSCREIRHRTDCTVVPAPFVADRANRGITLRDSNAEFELVAHPAPRDDHLADPLTHGE